MILLKDKECNDIDRKIVWDIIHYNFNSWVKKRIVCVNTIANRNLINVDFKQVMKLKDRNAISKKLMGFLNNQFDETIIEFDTYIDDGVWAKLDILQKYLK